MIPFSKYLQISFTAKLLLATIGLIVGTTMSLNYYFFMEQKDEILVHLNNRSQSLARILAYDSRLGAFIEDEKELLPSAKLILAERDCQRVIIYSKDGHILLEIKKETSPLKNSITIESKDIFATILRPATSWPISYTSDEVIIVSEPIYTRNPFQNDELFFDSTNMGNQQQTASPLLAKPIAYATVIMDTSTSKKKAADFLHQSVSVTLAVSMSSCFLIFLILKFMTRPLARLTAEINRYNQPTTIEKPARISTHMDFREMISIIRDSFQTINILKENLEEQVETRTQDLKRSNQDLLSQKNSLELANLHLENTLTELHQTQSQLIQSEKMAALGQVISGLSHEINNSINFITGSLPLLENNLVTIKNVSPSGDTSKKENERHKAEANIDLLLASIKEGVKRITSIIGDLRTFSHNREELAPIDIQSGLAASISLLRHQYKGQVIFSEDFAPFLPSIEGQEGQLNQVFMNILINAAQSITGTGTVTTKTWSSENHIHISINDDGSGIDTDTQARIFDPFFTTKEVGKGTGLGLSVSYSVVQKHFGKITVDSTPGKGSLFEIILPRQHAFHRTQTGHSPHDIKS